MRPCNSGAQFLRNWGAAKSRSVPPTLATIDWLAEVARLAKSRFTRRASCAREDQRPFAFADKSPEAAGGTSI